ncbi:MAG TPA: arsenic transporter [Myxococcales bacterium]|nr:arsenic transporter [Myxococcales bacterium]
MSDALPVSSERLASLVREKKILVCCGAGGVGKTTTAAALGLAAARAGRRVLVLTIDPARRLAEAMGIPEAATHPSPVPRDRLEEAGVAPGGALDAWMLNPAVVFENMVRRLAPDEERARAILDNRIYQQISQMVAGMQEYTAAEAVYDLSSEGGYDLVVLDTPPSRNALDFLEAPGRLSRLLDMKIFKAFLPKQGSLLTRAASALIHRVLASVFGGEFASEFVSFLASFAGLFTILNGDVASMRSFLSGSDAAFLLVCSPTPASLVEACFFQEKTRELSLPLRGFVLNRSRACVDGRLFPTEELLAQGAGPEARAGLAKLQQLATAELAAAERDRVLLADLRSRAGEGCFALAVPELPQGADDMRTLVAVADALLSGGVEKSP